MKHTGFLGSSDGKVSAWNVGDPGLIPGWGRSPGEGNGNPLQYSCLENPKDRGALLATVHGVAKSQTWQSDFTFTMRHIGSWFPSQWLNQQPLYWKCRVLATGPPGKSLSLFNNSYFSVRFHFLTDLMLEHCYSQGRHPSPFSLLMRFPPHVHECLVMSDSLWSQEL